MLVLLDLLIPFLTVLDVKVLIQDVVEPLMILLDIPEGFQLHPHVLIPLGYRLGKTLTPLGLVEGLIRGPHVVHIWSPLGFNEVVLGRMLRAKQILQRLLPWFLLHTSTSLLLMVGNSCGLLICVVATILWHHSGLHK